MKACIVIDPAVAKKVDKHNINVKKIVFRSRKSSRGYIKSYMAILVMYGHA